MVSAGNNDNGHDKKWPACSINVVAVGAHNDDGHRGSVVDQGQRVYWSNFQPYVRLSAPGTDIWTTDMVGFTSNGFYKGKVDPRIVPHECKKSSGTSLSSPLVAAVAALVLGSEPALTPAQAKQRLLATSKDLPFPYEWGNAVEIGAIDAYAAVTGGAH